MTVTWSWSLFCRILSDVQDVLGEIQCFLNNIPVIWHDIECLFLMKTVIHMYLIMYFNTFLELFCHQERCCSYLLLLLHISWTVGLVYMAEILSMWYKTTNDQSIYQSNCWLIDITLYNIFITLYMKDDFEKRLGMACILKILAFPYLTKKWQTFESTGIWKFFITYWWFIDWVCLEDDIRTFILEVAYYIHVYIYVQMYS